MPKNDKDGARLRAAPRIKTFQPAEMSHGMGEPLRVHLLNLSTGGALVHASTAPAIGQEVRLTCGIPLGSARVQWTEGNRFGVRFADPIGPEQVDRIVRRRTQDRDAPVSAVAAPQVLASV